MKTMRYVCLCAAVWLATGTAAFGGGKKDRAVRNVQTVECSIQLPAEITVDKPTISGTVPLGATRSRLEVRIGKSATDTGQAATNVVLTLKEDGTVSVDIREPALQAGDWVHMVYHHPTAGDILSNRVAVKAKPAPVNPIVAFSALHKDDDRLMGRLLVAAASPVEITVNSAAKAFKDTVLAAPAGDATFTAGLHPGIKRKRLTNPC